MDNYRKIEIETLMGNDIIPKYLEAFLPIRYIQIRRAIDKLILEKHYCKIEYDLLTNGKKKEDSWEYISGKVLLVPKVGSGFKIDQQTRVFYIPFEKPKCVGNVSSKNVSTNNVSGNVSTNNVSGNVSSKNVSVSGNVSANNVSVSVNNVSVSTNVMPRTNIKPIRAIHKGWTTPRTISENNKTRKILDMLKEKNDIKIKRRLDKKNK